MTGRSCHGLPLYLPDGPSDLDRLGLVAEAVADAAEVLAIQPQLDGLLAVDDTERLAAAAVDVLAVVAGRLRSADGLAVLDAVANRADADRLEDN